jgi:hypothetical protein
MKRIHKIAACGTAGVGALTCLTVGVHGLRETSTNKSPNDNTLIEKPYIGRPYLPANKVLELILDTSVGSRGEIEVAAYPNRTTISVLGAKDHKAATLDMRCSDGKLQYFRPVDAHIGALGVSHTFGPTVYTDGSPFGRSVCGDGNIADAIQKFDKLRQRDDLLPPVATTS